MNCKECKHIQKDVCPCTYNCKTHGKCCECIAYHRKNQELPACYFTIDEEKTYDRSVEYYTKNHNI